MDLVASLDHITSTHHALLYAELPRLDAGLAGAPPTLARPWRELSTLLRDHLAKEEQILFPLIRAVARDGDPAGMGLEGPVRQMSFEHARITALEALVRKHVDLAGPHRDRLVVVLDDLQVHASLEEDEVFPAAVARAAEHFGG